MGDVLLLLFLMLIFGCYGLSLRVNQKEKWIGFVWFWFIIVPSLLGYLVCIVLRFMNTDIWFTIVRGIFTADLMAIVLHMLIRCITEIVSSIHRFISRR